MAQMAMACTNLNPTMCTVVVAAAAAAAAAAAVIGSGRCLVQWQENEQQEEEQEEQAPMYSPHPCPLVLEKSSEKTIGAWIR